MPDDFLIRALLAAVGVALAAGPLGCFVVWRRMAYFGDATAHAAILGVAVALAFSISVFIGVLIVALLVAFAVSGLSHRAFGMDTILGVIAHSSLALGLVAVSFLSDVRIDLIGFLFGDVLTVSGSDLIVIWLGCPLILGLLIMRWRPLLLSTLNPDLAASKGYDARREQLVLTVALAILVAVSIKVVGALLITAMLLIPAAAARVLSRTPEAMAGIAALIAVASACGGLALSLVQDTPAGPSIVVIAAGIFVLVNLGNVARR